MQVLDSAAATQLGTSHELLTRQWVLRGYWLCLVTDAAHGCKMALLYTNQLLSSQSDSAVLRSRDCSFKTMLHIMYVLPCWLPKACDAAELSALLAMCL